MTKSNELVTVSRGGQSLALRHPQTWSDVLLPIFGNPTPVVIYQGADEAKPPLLGYLEVLELNLPPEATESQADDALRARVTPETRALISAEDQQALDVLAQRLRQAGDPFNDLQSEQIGERIGTLLMSAPPDIVMNELAEAVRRNGDHLSLLEAREYVCDAALTFAEIRTHEGRTIQPTFDSDEFGRMAQYVQDRAAATISAAGPREFYADDSPVAMTLIDAFIHKVLEGATLWDRARKERASVSNRLIAEVRGALMRKWPRPPQRGNAAREVAGEVLHALPGPALVAPLVVAFAEERLVLEPTDWTASSELFAMWKVWCADRGAAPGRESSFFQALNEWGGGCIRRTKPRPAQVPGYQGIALAGA